MNYKIALLFLIVLCFATFILSETAGCGENEEFKDCGSACPPTCEDDPNNPPICPQVCVPECQCKDGYVLNSAGKCVKPEDC